jgi:hypothetical protein
MNHIVLLVDLIEWIKLKYVGGFSRIVSLVFMLDSTVTEREESVPFFGKTLTHEMDHSEEM